ncbi:hypothetical protein MUO98_06890 [Candidatus Bathyarchaeota archaeon]|nr:hypothetical protein [Candidatus Bathyarchaeota archaeon]
MFSPYAPVHNNRETSLSFARPAASSFTILSCIQMTLGVSDHFFSLIASFVISGTASDGLKMSTMSIGFGYIKEVLVRCFA